MTPMNHAFQDSYFCVVPSQLTLGGVYNYFSQLNIMEVILCQLWDQPLLGLELSIFSCLELSLLSCSFWNPTTILWSNASSHVERPKPKKTKSPTNSLGWVPIESPSDSNRPSSPADIAQTSCRIVGEWIIVFEPPDFEMACYVAIHH